MHPAEEHFTRHEGPLAISAGCKLCHHTEVTKKLPDGYAGRGWGFREGNKLRGRMIQHIKAKHPEVLTEAKP